MNNIKIIVDLGFGDSGKGATVDFLTRQIPNTLIVRYNGGPQCGHNVVTGKIHHTFAQFGSGMFVPQAKTHLSKYMLIDPLSLISEAFALYDKNIKNIMQRTYIDKNALVVTPFHKAANRLKEAARGKEKHGSCGMGVGEVVGFEAQYGKSLIIEDLLDKQLLCDKLHRIQELELLEVAPILGKIKFDALLKYELDVLSSNILLKACHDRYLEFTQQVHIVSDMQNVLKNIDQIIFEGAQGILLDELCGFEPHTTWSNTTDYNARLLLEEWKILDKPTVLGTTRTYMTRHGAGPLPTENKELKIPEAHNPYNRWQENFRIGYLDIPALLYSLKCVKIDGLVVNHVDMLNRLGDIMCIGYNDKYFRDAANREFLFKGKPILSKVSPVSRYIDAIEDELKIPTMITADGPTAAHRKIIT